MIYIAIALLVVAVVQLIQHGVESRSEEPKRALAVVVAVLALVVGVCRSSGVARDRRCRRRAVWGVRQVRPLLALWSAAVIDKCEEQLRAMDRDDTARNAREVVKALGVDDDAAALRVGLVIDLAGHLALDLRNEPPRRRRQLVDAFVEMAVTVLPRS